VRAHHCIDESRTRFQFVDAASTFFLAVGPDAGAEAVDVVVGQFDCLVQIVDLEQRSHRTESLLPKGGRVLRYLAQGRNLVEIARTVEALTAGEQAGACLYGSIYLVFDGLQDLRRGERPDVGVLAHRITHFKSRQPFYHAPFKLAVHPRMDDEAFGSDAGLTVVDVARRDRGPDGGAQVCA